MIDAHDTLIDFLRRLVIVIVRGQVAVFDGFHPAPIVNQSHLERLPESWKGLTEEEQAAQLKAAVERTLRALQGDYRLAIPQWYLGQFINLLGPVYFGSFRRGRKPDAALVISKNPYGNMYQLRTILTLPMAYKNARLIGRLDGTWLDPSCKE